VALLILGAADGDGIGAKEGGQDPGRDAEVGSRHGLGHAVDVVGAGAEPAVLLGDEEQVEADLIGVVELIDDVSRKLVRRVHRKHYSWREFLLRVSFEARQDKVE
jgi:hypothetical protein